MDILVAEFENKRLDKVKEEATQDAIEKIKMEITSGRMNFLSGLQIPHYTKRHSLVVVNMSSKYIWLIIWFFFPQKMEEMQQKVRC